jgi:MerR family mercuric resistance operon transcriptional regulator
MATIGEAARDSGLKIETIRYYERVGIVRTPSRSDGGRRIFSTDDVAVLIFVKRCRDLGFPLSTIKVMLGLRDTTNHQCEEVQAIAERHIQNVRKKISDLQQLERAMVKLVSECKKGGTDCPALKKLFSA